VAGFSALDRGLVTNGYSDPTYPGLTGTGRAEVTVSGPAQPIANPPNGNPGALSSLPGIGGQLSSLLGSVAGDLAGQHAEFDSAPLGKAVDVVGAPTVQLRAASPTGEATLFVKLYDVDQDGASTLSGGLVAPVRLTGLPAASTPRGRSPSRCPRSSAKIAAGHVVRIVVANLRPGVPHAGPAHHLHRRGRSTVTLPTVEGTPIANPETIWWYVLAGYS